MMVSSKLRIAQFTYSTNPRGGVAHTLALTEHLQEMGQDVHIFTLGKTEQDTFPRSVSVPFTLIPAFVQPDIDEPLDERIQRYIQTYYEYLLEYLPDPFDIYHAQDCISANALWRIREDGLIPSFIRTIHHIEDFTSDSLIECQNNSIYRPNFHIVVSNYWQQLIANEYGVVTSVIYNGVDIDRFRQPTHAERSTARAKLGLKDQVVILNIGGIEPRKNSIRLLHAFQSVRDTLAVKGRSSVLLLAGGATLLDYQSYRDEFFNLLESSDLQPDKDIFTLGTVSDTQIQLLYQAADIFCFPSVKEGWGLVVLEAMSSGVVVLASDLPVFREYLQSEENAVLVDPYSEQSIADGLIRLALDDKLRRQLTVDGLKTAESFSWTTTARRHLEYYKATLSGVVKKK